jgi:DNA-binding PadR family transcriptional regulator
LDCSKKTGIDFLARSEKKILIAYIPLIVLFRIRKTKGTTAAKILRYIRTYGHQISAGTFYPIIVSLMSEGYIKTANLNNKKHLFLTENGQITVKLLHLEIRNVQEKIEILIEG